MSQRKPKPELTDHAVIRFLERVKGLDIDAIKAEMLPDRTREAIEFMGNGKVVNDRYTLVVRDGRVVTVIL